MLNVCKNRKSSENKKGCLKVVLKGCFSVLGADLGYLSDIIFLRVCSVDDLLGGFGDIKDSKDGGSWALEWVVVKGKFVVAAVPFFYWFSGGVV